MKVTVENHELVCSQKIDEALAKKLLRYQDRVTNLEHDLHIRHKVSHSENGELISVAKIGLTEGDDIVVLTTKLKESHTTLLEQASTWKVEGKKPSRQQEEPSKQQEEEVYVCLKRMKQGYVIGGNMPLEEVVQAVASMFTSMLISYANKK